MRKGQFLFLLCLAILVMGLALYLAFPVWRVLQEETASLSCFCPSCPETEGLGTGIATFGQIQVEVAGAVKKPGIYALRTGQRHAEAIALAGGFSSDADQKYLAQQYNLATTLSDGEKIYIPFTAEESSQAGGEENASPEVSATNCTSINQASQSQLEELNGIGSKRASDIIAGRPYGKLEDLTEKEILSESLFNDIASAICL